MTATEFLTGIAIAWLVTGLVLGFTMRRRGHEFTSWLALGAVLGPLAIPIAFQNIGSEADIEAEALSRDPTKGEMDVLIALDGSKESDAAMRSALAVIGTQPSSLTFATVLDYESHTPLAVEEKAQAQRLLDAAVRRAPAGQASTVILYGDPKHVIPDFARETGKNLIVIGARGHGASKFAFGSVARAIVGGCEVPIMVGPEPAHQRLPQMSPD